MGRTLLCSLAGAGAGFLVGFVVVQIAAGAAGAEISERRRALQRVGGFSLPVAVP